jgi:hypothetical protein
VIERGSSLGRGAFKNEGEYEGEWGRGVKMGEMWKSVEKWYQDLAKQEDLAVEKVLEHIPLSVCQPNEEGWKYLKRWTVKFGLAETIECAKISFDQYYHETQETWEKAFNMIPRIAHCRKLKQKDPSLAEAYRLRGILKARLSYCNYSQALDVLAALVDEKQLEFAESLCHQARSWTQFHNQATARLNEVRAA